MADDNVNYTSKITGKTVSPSTIVSEELNALQTLVDKGETSITDANVGSEVRNLLESMAYSQYQYRFELDKLAEMVLVRYATGEWLDDIGYAYGVQRKKGNQASGIVTFTISTPRTTDLTIPAGTMLISTKGLNYRVSADTTIPASTTSNQTNTANVVAVAEGEDYNCDAKTINAFDTEQTFPKDVQVTNLSPFENGTGTEDDDSYRTRIFNKMRGGWFGSVGYYRNLIVSNVDNVHDVNFVAPEMLNAIESGRHTIKVNNTLKECNDCTAVCVVNIHTKTDVSNTLAENTETIYQVQKLLTNERNILLGHKFHVQSAYLNPLYFKINYYGVTGATVTEDDVFTCLTKFFFGGTYDGDQTITYTGVNVGGTVYKEEIITALENIKGIHHVENLSLLGWHEDMETIEQLTKYYTTKTGKTWTYTNILDYPDEDDDDFSVKKNSTLPCWKILTDSHFEANENETVYQLTIDDYYFYKVKDNLDNNDDNAGEHAINSEWTDWWLWGIKQFNELTMYPDVVPFVGSVSSRQTYLNEFNDAKKEENTHSVWLKCLGTVKKTTTT